MLHVRHAAAAINEGLCHTVLVTLEEGPRMMSNVVGCPQTPEALQLDMPLEVTFTKMSDDITLPFVKPREA